MQYVTKTDRKLTTLAEQIEEPIKLDLAPKRLDLFHAYEERNLVSREGLLARIDACFSRYDSHPPSTNNQFRCCVLSGTPGSGKSQLSFQYARNNVNDGKEYVDFLTSLYGAFVY